jgi:hypothetical protein
MSIERVFNFMDRHAGKIIVLYFASGAAFFGLVLWVCYRILKHFQII